MRFNLLAQYADNMLHIGSTLCIAQLKHLGVTFMLPRNVAFMNPANALDFVPLKGSIYVTLT